MSTPDESRGSDASDQRGRNLPWHWKSPWSLEDEDLLDAMPPGPAPPKPPVPASAAARKPAPGSTAPKPVAAKAPRTPADIPAPSPELTAAARAAERALRETAQLRPHGPLRKRLKKRTSVSWFGISLLWLGLAGLVFLIWVYLQEIPEESDEDLRIHQAVERTTAGSVQAPHRLRSLLDSIAQLHDPRLIEADPWTWDTPALARFVTSNGTTADNLRDLLEDENWHPRHIFWHASDLGSHQAWPQLAVLLRAQCAYLARRGDEESAFTSAIDIAELSRRLQDLWAWPSFIQRSHELHLAGCEAIAALLRQTRLDNTQLQRFQVEFIECAPSTAAVQDAVNAFYLHEKKLLLGPASGEPADTMPQGVLSRRAGRLFFKTRDTLSLFANAFRSLKTDIAAPRFATVTGHGHAAAFHPGSASPGRRFYRPNSAGEDYFAERMLTYWHLPESHSLAAARHALVVQGFAICRYRADHQKLPAQLDDLRPRYLDHLPTDPFSGEPFRYDAARGTVHSVGIDLADEALSPTSASMASAHEPSLQLKPAPSPAESP